MISLAIIFFTLTPTLKIIIIIFCSNAHNYILNSIYQLLKIVSKLEVSFCFLLGIKKIKISIFIKCY